MQPSEISATTELTQTETSAARETTLGRDDFLRMLIAQLENQDPLNPQDATEFTAQLAQFSALEQLISIRTSVEGLAGGSGASEILQATSLIGREVLAESQQVELATDGAPVDIEIDLPFSSGAAHVTLADSLGRGVRTLDLGALGQGRHTVVWNGLDDQGNAVAPGVYGLRAESGDGTSLTTLVRGRVTGAAPAMAGSESVVMLGDVVVTLSRVVEIREAGTAR